MGCFDFTYADNGENIRGRRGYIYLSPQVAAKANLPNPLPFDGKNMYGRFAIRMGPRGINIDIFSLYTVLIHNDENKLCKNELRFMNLLHNREFENEYQDLNNSLRNDGIQYFCHNTKYRPDELRITIPKLGNQREKNITTHIVCEAETPLLISRKKLPVDINTSLKIMAKTWGYVSTNDPNQGFTPTHNRYCKYICI